MATDQKYTDDPHISSISGTERSPIAQSGVDLYITPDDQKTYTLNGYAGASTITTVGTITGGTWSGKFAPRVTTTTTASTLLCAPDLFDVQIITALASAITIDIKILPQPNSCQRFEIRIKDNGSPQTLAFNPSHVRFLGVTNPGTTTTGQTVYFVFEYNFANNIWDCILCTDSTGGGSTSLTSTYVGYGDSSNLVTGNSNFTYNSNGTLSVINSSVNKSAIYAENNAFNIGGDGPIVAYDGTVSGETLSLGYSSTSTFNIRPHSGQLLFEGGGAANGSFSMHGSTYVTLGLGVGFGFGSITALLNIAAGTATAGTAPIKLTAGTNLTTPEDGAVEYDSSHLYFTIGSTRYQLDQQGALLTSSNNTWSGTNTFSGGVFINTSALTIGDVNVGLGVGVGTKWGTSTSQKQAWYNSTPVVQQTTSITAASFTANTSGTLNDSATWGGYTIGQVVAALKLYGFLA